MNVESLRKKCDRCPKVRSTSFSNHADCDEDASKAGWYVDAWTDLCVTCRSKAEGTEVPKSVHLTFGDLDPGDRVEHEATGKVWEVKAVRGDFVHALRLPDGQRSGCFAANSLITGWGWKVLAFGEK